MEQEVLRHRNAVFNRVYYSSLALYKTVVPVPLRWLMELYLLLMAALTLLVWGYVHFTYIVNSKDCLLNITERPFPQDAIIQVEVYSNTSDIWLHREKALQDMYNRMYNRHYIEDFERKSRRRSAAWIRGYCGSSFFINLTGTNFFCQLILTELAKSLGNIAKDMHSSMTGGGSDDAKGSTVNGAVKDGVTVEDSSEEAGGSSRSMQDDVTTGDSDGDREGVGATDADGDRTAVTTDGVTAEGVTTEGGIEDMASGTTAVDGANARDSIKNEVKRTLGGRTSDCTATTARKAFYDVVLRRSTYCNSDFVNLHASSFYSKNYTLYDLFEFYDLNVLAWDYTVLEFSQEPGYLSLTTAARSRLNISVFKIYLDPSKVTCFGGPFGQFLTEYFLGYDMMVISSFKSLLPSNRASGYVKNMMTGNQYYYKVQWMGKWRYSAGILPALFFTLVASVLLRRIHYHIFKFLTHFHHLLNQGIPMPIQTGAQIPFLVVTYATIGLVIVMSEALSDDSVFSLLMVCTVWEVDQFYSVFCKQNNSKQYLPWFFFLYHFLPYAYYIRFNGQFWFIPFLFHWIMLQHTMLFFLHHSELPSLEFGRRRAAFHLQLVPRLPPVPQLHPAGEPIAPQRGVVPQPQEGSQNEVNVERAPSETSTPTPIEHNLQRTELHGIRPSHNTVIAGTSAEPTQETSNSQSGQSQLLTEEQLRKVRLQHFERKKD